MPRFLLVLLPCFSLLAVQIFGVCELLFCPENSRKRSIIQSQKKKEKEDAKGELV